MKRTHIATTPPMSSTQLDRLAGLVRILRKPVDPDGTDPNPLNPPDEVKAAALAALGAWADIWYDGDRALDRAVDHAAGISASSSVEGHGKGGHSDPTFDQATSDRTDSFGAEGHQLRDAIVNGTAHALNAKRLTDKVLRSAPPMTAKDRARCSSADVGCEENAVKGDPGYCSPCWQWLHRHDDVHQVPRAVIQQRKDDAARRAAASKVTAS